MVQDNFIVLKGNHYYLDSGVRYNVDKIKSFERWRNRNSTNNRIKKNEVDRKNVEYEVTLNAIRNVLIDHDLLLKKQIDEFVDIKNKNASIDYNNRCGTFDFGGLYPGLVYAPYIHITTYNGYDGDSYLSGICDNDGNPIRTKKASPKDIAKWMNRLRYRNIFNEILKTIKRDLELI